MPVSVRRFRLFPVSIGQAFLWALLLSLALLLIAPPVVDAQVVTNITPTTSALLDLGTNVDTVGSTTEITGGTRPGNGTNLFHSFDAFTLGTGDTAHFLNDMQLPTNNIFGRVIGGEVSTIDGTLRTNNPLNAADPMNFGAANLWLVNPSGLLLGPNARIEVGGSVSMSTANYLRFEGTAALFDMLSSPASLGPLSVAPVAAFGFLGSNPVLNATQSTLLVQGGTVEGSKTLTLVGRDATVGGTATPGIVLSGGTLSNSDGQINLVSVGLPQDLVKGGEIQAPSLISVPAASGHAFNTMGEIKLSGASLDTSGTTGGGVFIRGGQLTIDNGRIIAEKTGNTSDSPTGIDIKLDGAFALNLTEQILALDTLTFGAGDGGDVKIAASKVILNFSGEEGFAPTVIAAGGNVVITAIGDVNLNRVGVINEAAPGPGNVGSIVIKGTNVTVTNSFIGSEAAFTTHNPSSLEIEATSSVKLIGPSFISSISGSGQLAGNVTITAKNFLMEGNAVITAHTQGAGNAGNIIIKADNLVMGSESPLSPPTIRNDSNEGATGNAGSIDLSVGRLTMNPHSSLTSVSAGGGNAGNVDVHGLGGKGTPANVITLDNSVILTTNFGGSAANTPGDISITAQTLALVDGAQIRADTFGEAPAGDIVITAKENLSIRNSLLSSETLGSGDAGTVSIDSKSFTVLGGEISTRTAGAGDGGQVAIHAAEDFRLEIGVIETISQGFEPGAGKAGDVSITAGNFVLDRARIATSTHGPGQGGNLTLTAVEDVSLASGGLFAMAEGTQPLSGDAGNILVTARNVTLTDGSRFSSKTDGPGRGGNVTVLASDTVTLVGDPTIAGDPANTGFHAGAEGAGPGAGGAGAILVGASEIMMTQGARVDARTIGPGSGGRVTLRGVEGSRSSAVSVFIDGTGSGVFTTAEGTGAGGNINVQAARMTLDNDATVSAASSSTGNAGTITINAGSEFLSTNSSVTTEATQASGGNITLVASDMIRLRDSQISASVSGETQTAGGNITIDPQFVILQNSQIIARADAGSGGTINVTAGVFITDPASIVDASATSGNSGTVSIQSPVQNVGGQLTPLPQEFSSAAALLFASRCAADPTGQFSSFVQTGREGVPQIPGALSPSPLSFLETLTSGALGSPSPNVAAARLGLDSVRFDDRTRFHSACRS